ncbi:sensor histidine kinase [Azospirillum brasilense]|uniref:sensor histidine kinase n=1 Tax=Azospirillum brasilense TaxID=192 RepID=UPI000E0AD2DF|nr:PAS domain-containing sensor histidine kinase [Azospirillum brasilense]
MQLDGNTLFAMTGGMIFLSALVATLLYKLHTSVPGPRGWAWGNILVGVFFLLRMLPAPVPEWLSIAVANGILLLGQGFIYTGMRRFVGLPPLPAVPYLAAFLVGTPLLWLLDDGNARVALVSAGLLVLSIATVAALVGRDDGSVIGRRLVIGLFAVNAAILAVRVAFALGSSMTMVPNAGGGGAMALVLFIWNIPFTFIGCAGMVLMVAERLATQEARRAELLAGEVRERERVARLLAESERQLSDLVSSSPLPILVVFPDSLTVAFLNQRAADLLAPIQGSAIGARLPDLIDLGAAGEPDTMLQARSRPPGEPWESETLARLPDGRRLWLRVSAAAVGFARREALIVNLNDISVHKDLEQSLDAARRKAETALEIQRKAMAEQRNFLAMVSHEFRNPLAVIHVAVDDLTGMGNGSAGKSIDKLARIRRAAQRMHKLVEDCLAEDWLEAASLTPALQPLDAVDATRSLCADLALLHRHAAFAVDLPNGPTTVMADPSLLSVALSNLIDNAVKYSNPCVVTVTLSVEDGTVRLRVHNPGPAILPADRDHIFEKFYRSPNVGRRAGAGLGLYLVRRIMEAHAGRIEVDSRDGAGTAFTLLLPHVAPVRAGSAHATQPEITFAS